MEHWKDIRDYEGIYQVSNLGRVKRIKGGTGATIGHILKPKQLKSGYVQYGLSDKPHNKGKVQYIKGHKLVLEAFVCPRPKGLECNHKNGNRSDNHFANLAWVTRFENMRHAFDELGRQPLFGERNGCSKLTADDVREIREMAASTHYKHHEIAAHFNVGRVQITRIVNRTRWAHI